MSPSETPPSGLSRARLPLAAALLLAMGAAGVWVGRNLDGSSDAQPQYAPVDLPVVKLPSDTPGPVAKPPSVVTPVQPPVLAPILTPVPLPEPPVAVAPTLPTIAELTEQYGPDAVRYAQQVIANGGKIKVNPTKEAEYEKIRLTLVAKYPNIKIPRLFGYADDEREVENMAAIYSAREKIKSAARVKGHEVYLPMSFILAALSNEGHSLDVDAPEDLYGFGNYGLDTFGSEVNKIIAKGYLPETFRQEFTTSAASNEAGAVTTATFKSKAAAFTAFVATLAHRQLLFFEELKRVGLHSTEFTPDEILFYTYVYYNGGPDLLDDVVFNNDPKTRVRGYFEEVKPAGAKGNGYVVLSGHQWLTQAGSMDPEPQGKYWWSK